LFGALWNVALLKHATPALHWIDVYGRIGVITLIGFHIIASGLSLIFLMFIATERAGGVLKLNWLRRVWACSRFF
jgi:hypothetical protein